MSRQALAIAVNFVLLVVIVNHAATLPAGLTRTAMVVGAGFVLGEGYLRPCVIAWRRLRRAGRASK